MKKIFLFTIIVGFLLLNLSPLLAQAEEHDHYRTIGKGVASWCDHNEGESWTCTCQNSNVVQCQVGNIISDPICACCGDCTLNNFLGIGINLANLIFQYLGVVALLFFVIGGVIWITSGGSQERIKMGKTILKNAIIGIIVIIAANLIIRFVTEVLGVEDEYLEDLGPGEEEQE